METIAAPETDILDQIDESPLIATIERWSRINSGSRNLGGLATMAGLIADHAAALPGEVRLHDPAPVESIDPAGKSVLMRHGRNLVLSVRPDAPRRVLLTGHMDTVYGVDHAFQTPRWRDDGTLNGPGVADMKGGLVVMFAALGALEASESGAGLGYDVLVNADEEIGSAGSAPLISDLARGKIAALTYEPALPDGTLAGARPGSGNYALVVRGRSAHAGRNPQDGRNAVVAAADLTMRLASLAGDGLSVNPARIEGGGPNNIVPDLAILHINLRPRDPADQARAEAAIAEAIAEVAASRDVSVTRHGGFGRPPKPLDAAAERLFGLVRDCGRDLGLTIGWRATGGVCDGNNIAAMGVPVVDTMGVRGGAIHTADEFLIADSVVERARLSALLLMRLARGALA